jgi:SAM-dependent methyltransferase
MSSYDDAYGRLIYDHSQGKEAIEIVEREDGFISVSGGPAVYFSAYADWPAYEQEAMAYARGRVLDIGCGAGRHDLYLQEQGLVVTGIDNSPLAIEVCRQRGLQDARLMPVTAVNSHLGRFDTILMMGNNFGLMANPRRARWLLQRFNALTTANGRIIANSLDPYQTTEPFHLEYQEFNRRRGRMPGQIRIRIRYRKYKGAWFDYLLVSQAEMARLLQGTPWTVAHFIEDAGGRGVYIAILEKRR